MKKSLFVAMLAACVEAGCSKPDTPLAASPAPAEVAAALTARPTAVTGGVPARLCAVLRAEVPELKGMSGVGARAQLVMAIGTAFDSDAKSLSVVSADIDAIASSGCAEVRAPLLAATRATSLQEAVR